MATSSERWGGASATAARTKSCTGLPSRVTNVDRGVGDAAGVVGLQNGLGGGEARADRLGPTAEAGEEVRLDESGDDAHVGVDVVALQQDRRALDPSHLDVVSAVGVVVDDGVAVHDLGPDQLAPSRSGWPGDGCPVAQSSVTASSGTPLRSSRASKRRQHGAVGHGSGQVGEDHHHPVGPRRQLGQRRPGQRAFQGPAHGTLLIGEPGQVEGLDHRGVVRHLHLPPLGAVGQLDQHGFSAWARCRSTGTPRWRRGPHDATWSTWGRIRR